MSSREPLESNAVIVPSDRPHQDKPKSAEPELVKKPKAKLEVQVLPEKFHGVWTENLSSCGPDIRDFDDTVLTVSGRELLFWESIHNLQSIVRNGPGDVSVVTAAMGEGEAWRGEFQMILSEDGDTLSIASEGSSFDRFRCSPVLMAPEKSLEDGQEE
ncbi:MAG: hypothetical protein ABJF89_01160 [Parasphingorhabdus sp.]|uniref:hypothetical protein n=1 Tax=Parasphingorhabdus sp. TaxID=2709688 RepID=UPI003262F6B9